MQIDLSETTLSIAKNQATAAGFSSVNDYIANLITDQQSGNLDNRSTRAEALEKLHQLRQEVPKFSTEEIVDMVREARVDLL